MKIYICYYRNPSPGMFELGEMVIIGIFTDWADARACRNNNKLSRVMIKTVEANKNYPNGIFECY